MRCYELVVNPQGYFRKLNISYKLSFISYSKMYHMFPMYSGE